MGAGKSAVGRQLARLLHLEFVDSDQEIESRTGVDIPFIFEKEGETGFRQREAKVIDDLSQKEGIVLATGGGAIVDPENRTIDFLLLDKASYRVTMIEGNRYASARFPGLELDLDDLWQEIDRR